jgi:hypothetical protein
MYKARWSNGVSYAIEFDFDEEFENSLVNALATLKEFMANAGKFPTTGKRWSRIPELHVRSSKYSWSTPIRLEQIARGVFQGVSFSVPVPVHILTTDYQEASKWLIGKWEGIFPLMLNVLKWVGALDNLIMNISDDLQLECDLADWDEKLRKMNRSI